MKKKWLIAPIVVASIGGGYVIYQRLFDKKKSNKLEQREQLVNWFSRKGYKVHSYNQNNDFILFHHEKNEKIHLLYDDGNITEDEFCAKLNSYYLHFTNEFLFISKNSDVLEKNTKKMFYNWHQSINQQTINECGEIIVHFQTFDDVISE